jgi:hypothetical protein
MKQRNGWGGREGEDREKRKREGGLRCGKEKGKKGEGRGLCPGPREAKAGPMKFKDIADILCYLPDKKLTFTSFSKSDAYSRRLCDSAFV